MGLKHVKRRYQVDLRMAEIIENLALEQARDPEQIAVDMLAEGIAKRMRTEESFEYWARLSPREQEVTALVCLGFMNKEIGEKLVITEPTVKTHVSNVLHKFGVQRRGEIQYLLSDWDFSEWDL
ncbi:LuxR C-terminal-related transcriptional regulator [Chloroflexota bacterium]